MEDVRWGQVKTDEDRWNITHAPWVCLWIQSDEVLWESAPMFEHMANDLWPVAYDSQMRANAVHSGDQAYWVNHIKPPFLMAKRLNDKCENISVDQAISLLPTACVSCVSGGPASLAGASSERAAQLAWLHARMAARGGGSFDGWQKN